ncbi:MAG: hypothetical protein WBF87_14640 [Mesorhizobium sp.]
MSLPILVAIVAFGIALTVAAVHFTGGSKIATVKDDAHARTLFLADYPNEKPGATSLTADRQSAFMALPGDRLAIVQSFGDGFFTRIVTAGDVASIRLREPATVSIRFRDFTWTGGHFHFDDASKARAIVSIFGVTREA